MKSQHYVLIMIILAAGAFWLLSHKTQIATSQQQATTTNVPVAKATAGQTSANNSAVQTKTDVVMNTNPGDTNTASDVVTKYRQGLIGKDQAVQATIQEENKKSLDIYGKVVDQYGNPVSGAKVRGAIGLNISMVESGGEFRYTETDTQGCSNFLGIHGAGIGIWPQKEGYYYNLKIPWRRPEDYRPDANNPIVFKMWKIHGAESLVQSSLTADLSPDGNIEIFDMATGKQTQDGNLRITFLRVPSKIKPGLVHPYDWQFKLEVQNGGLVQENDSYPYWAPDNGYQPSFEFEMSSNNVPWHNQFEQNFYIKDSNGKYGVMNFIIYSASTPPQAQINFTINLSGSQNLEPASFP